MKYNSDIKIKYDRGSVLVITEAPFPYGNAMSSRIRAFCKLFCEIGYRVHVIATFSRLADCLPGEIYGEDCYTFEISSNRSTTSLETFIGNYKFMSKIIKYMDSHDDVRFIFSDSCQCYFEKIAKYAREKNILYFVEQCEKYDISSYKFGKLDYRYWKHLNLYNKGYKKANAIVAISRYLEEHYNEQGLKVIRIPTILDLSSTPYSTSTHNSPIRLVYTGIAWGHKELLAPIINVFAEDSSIRNFFEFKIYGTTKEQILDDEPSLSNVLSRTNDSVEFCGIVSQEKINQILKDADYQIFLRPDRESSRAGFPTKFGESMAAGTPVIANYTGDIDLYLIDGKNGFVVSEPNEEKIYSVLNRILHLSSGERMKMRISARKTAEKFFNYKSYIEQFTSIMQINNPNDGGR